MKRIESDGKKGIKFVDGRSRALTYREKKHIRWNYELDDHNPQMAKYNFVLHSLDAELNPATFVSDLFGEWGNSKLDGEQTYDKVKLNRRFSYQFFIVNSNLSPTSLHFNRFKEYDIIRDPKLKSNNKLGLEGYVDEMYAPKK